MSSSDYLKSRKPLRGGWDVTPSEYKAMGFTVGLPPSMYVPQTKNVIELSRRFESSDAALLDNDSSFATQERQVLFQAGKCVRCYVRDLPPGMDNEKLKKILNQKMNQRKITTQSDPISKVFINPMGQFAFVDFEKSKDAEKFIELKDSLEIEGHTIRIRRSHKDYGNEDEENINEDDIKKIVGQIAEVENVTIPKVDEFGLGYAIVELKDQNLIDLVVLKLRNIGIKCKRCFPRLGQELREEMSNDKLNQLNCYGKLVSDKFSILSHSPESYFITDILNLDIDISNITNEVQSYDLKSLRIFNVLSSTDPNEMESVVKDIEEECKAFGKILNIYVDLQFDCLVPQITPPIVVKFESSKEANKAQKGISGRRYKGRIVITMLE